MPSQKIGGDIYYIVNTEKNEHTLAFPPNSGSSRHNTITFTTSTPKYDKKALTNLTDKDVIAAINDDKISFEFIRETFISDFVKTWKGNDIQQETQELMRLLVHWQLAKIKANDIPRNLWKGIYTTEVYDALQVITGRDKSVEPESRFKPFISAKMDTATKSNSGGTSAKLQDSGRAPRSATTLGHKPRSRAPSPSPHQTGSHQTKDKHAPAPSPSPAQSTTSFSNLTHRVREGTDNSTLSTINVASKQAPNPTTSVPKKRGRPSKSNATSSPIPKNEIRDPSDRSMRPSKTSIPPRDQRTSRQVAAEFKKEAKKAMEKERMTKPKIVGKGVYGRGGYIEESMSPEPGR